jgi:hypothetical protein
VSLHPFAEVVVQESDIEDEDRARTQFRFFRCLDCSHLCFEKEVEDHKCERIDLETLAQRRK